MRRSIVCALLLGVVMAAYSQNDGLVTVEQKPVKGVGIVAHRGYWNCEAGGFARNSIAALKAAQDAGFWGS